MSSNACTHIQLGMLAHKVSISLGATIVTLHGILHTLQHWFLFFLDTIRFLHTCQET